MTGPRYRRSTGSVFSLKYHLVWCPKYRRAVLMGDIARNLEILLHEKADQLGLEIEALEVMPDHVYPLISSDPTETPQRIANQLKGYTSRILRQRHPSLRSRLPALWSRSYYVGSVGQVSEETVRRYIEAQKGV